MRKLFFNLILLFACSMSAQTYQATSASYQGEVSDGAVWLKEETDYVRFSVSASQAGTATVYVGVQSPYGDKVMNWQVNAQSGKVNTGEGTTELNIGSFSFNKGNNTITITPDWTWFAVTHIRITGLSTQGGSTDPEPVKPTGKFQVNGTQLLDGNGNPFRMLGCNLAYAWFKGYGYDRQMTAMQRAGANTVRVALSDGGKFTKDNYQTIQGIIKKAEELKMIVVLEVHDATGSDNAADLQAAANFWIEMKGALVGHEATTIINIANEWMGSWNKHSDYANAYKQVIQSMRNAGLHHCLMVDAAGWGQEVSSLSSKAQEILNADTDKNILFSVHMYGSAGAPGRVMNNISLLLAKQVAFVIGEFAWYHSDGDVDEDAIISTCKDKGVGWTAWSWWGNGSGLGYIDLVDDQYNENSYAVRTQDGQSCNWGQKVMQAWKTEAKVCTVYTQITTVEETILDINQLQNADSYTVFDLQGRPVSSNLNDLQHGAYIVLATINNKQYSTKIIIP